MLLGVGLLLPCGFWYGRNLLLTGNPVYPVQIEVVGVPVFHGWYDRAAMLRSGYHLRTDDLTPLAERLTAVIDIRLGSFWHEFEGTGSWWVACLLALAAIHVFCWPVALLTGLVAPLRGLSHWNKDQPNWRDRWMRVGLSVLSLAYVGIFWWVVPYQSQERFLFPAVGLAIVPLARLLQGRRWLQLGTVVVLLAHVTLHLPLVRELGLPHPWAVAPGKFYPSWDFAPNLLPAWEAVEKHSSPHAPLTLPSPLRGEGRVRGGTRVAYAGTNLPYYCFGRGLRNRVYYVNVNDHANFLPHDYHLARLAAGRTELARDPWPNWYREAPSYEAWLANLHSQGIDLLLVARENQHGRRRRDRVPPFPMEQQWARAHPEHFEELAVAPWAWVYRLNLKKNNE